MVMWNGFDGRPYMRDEFAAHVGNLNWTDWKPKGITLHNTSAPRLDQWAESGPTHDQRIRNLQYYYQTQLGWHAGPHLFISRHFINGFSDLTQPGVHSTCFNATHIGVEMVGDYNSETFDSGDGALVRDTAVFALATLYRALNLNPVGLTFHKQCTRDNHDCPGRNVNMADMIARVTALWRGLPAPPEPPAEPWEETQYQKVIEYGGSPRMAWIQDTLTRLQPSHPLEVDGDLGPNTEAAVKAFQRAQGLRIDGIPGRNTEARLKAVLAQT